MLCFVSHKVFGFKQKSQQQQVRHLHVFKQWQYFYPDDKISLCLHVRWNDIHHFAPKEKRQGEETDDDILDKLTCGV